ncbi:thioredoxin family protein [Spirosoma linguale]|uniref:Thioredoxin domain-containing protein n=1 Tax=Spirosoma linguale (strain ATCC 33905 / DSM 74 / LMG 10896 / Claus 1) TaxID=504472 RepID=D2QLK1_SPILD|nr:hypothetical protein Slin_4309 [Spirosoma linguale DSM 74]
MLVIRLLIIILAIFLPFRAQSQGHPARAGVQFRSGTFQSALALAKTMNKPLLVEVYLTGCPHCEALAPVLAEKAVGDYLNAHFVSWQVEANAVESVALQKEQSIAYPEFPLFLFFDPAGKLIHVGTPAEQPTRSAFIEEVISIGRVALEPSRRTEGYVARFAAGERDLSFLIQYGKYAKTRRDNALLHTISDAIGHQLLSPEQIQSPPGFYCLQRLIDDVDNPAAVYFFQHLSAFTMSYPVKDVKEAGESIVFRSLYGVKSDQYPAQKISQMRAYMVALGVPTQEAASRTLLKELDAYLRTKNMQGALLRFNDYRRENSSIGLADYAYLMHYFNEKATDDTYLSEMPVWASAGLKTLPAEQQNAPQVADIYYELAVAYHKMGQNANALNQARQGLNIAQKAKLNTQRFVDQVAAYQ